MTAGPVIRLSATVLDTEDPRRLADFYQQLLGWHRLDDADEWVRIGPIDRSSPGLSFQREPLHTPPSWPTRADHPQMQTHLDFDVDNLPQAVHLATSLGATTADHQPQKHVRVMADPAGHMFCLST